MSDQTEIGLLCGDIADIVFPWIGDRDRRSKLALALVELTRALRDEMKRKEGAA